MNLSNTCHILKRCDSAIGVNLEFRKAQAGVGSSEAETI